MPTTPSRPITRPWALIPWLLAVLVAPARVHAEAAPIFLDGRFADWPGPVEEVDPSGDEGLSGIDFREVDLANDDQFLFVRFQTTVDVSLQETSSISLYLDTDANAATGLAVAGIGAELMWNFGARNGTFYHGGGSTSIHQGDIRLRQLPSVTANEFEIAIGRDVLPDGVNPLFTGADLRLVLRDTGAGGDQAPDGTGGIAYGFDPTPVPPPAAIAFGKHSSGDVRVMTWNTRDIEGSSGFDPAVVPRADRVISAIEPDIICFQEIYNATAAQTQSLIEGMLPLLGPWYAAKQNDCHVVSRFPILQSWALDGNLAVLLDASSALGTDVLLVCAHLPCCTNDGGRQNEIDHIMSFFRDAKTAGGIVDVPSGTAFLIMGDLNLVGLNQQRTTLLTGDIVDEGTYGPDFAPDWDGSALGDVVSSQTERRFAYTWRNDASTYAPGRLDYVIYTDSVLELGNHYIVYSPEMSAAELAATGMQAGDVTGVSDHLPHVADFHATGAAVAVPAPPGPAGMTLRSQVGAGEVRSALDLATDAKVVIEVFDVSGARVRSLFGAPRHLGGGRHALVWDGRDDRGAPVTGGVYLARARALTGGHVETAHAKWVLLR